MTSRTTEASSHKRAKVITFLGIDGSGKSTQAGRLATWFRAQGQKCHFLAHDSLSPVRNILDTVAHDAGHADQFEMLGADTVRFSSAVVKLKSLLSARSYFEDENAFLIIDRYSECQYAAGRATGARNEALLRAMFASIPNPDLSLFIDVPPAVAKARIETRGIDSDPLSFLESFREAYLALPEAAAFCHIDGTASEDTVALRIQAAVSAAFPQLQPAP